MTLSSRWPPKNSVCPGRSRRDDVRRLSSHEFFEIGLPAGYDEPWNNGSPRELAMEKHERQGDSKLEFSRRRFLKCVGAAAAFAIVPRSVLGGPGHVAPSEKTTLAGVGVGGQGIQNMLRFAAMPEVRVVAVCDVERECDRYMSWNWSQGKDTRLAGRAPARRAIDEHYAERRRGSHSACRGYVDYRELLDKEDVDAVMVATPDFSHAMITLAAIRKGKHVYCEKPLTYSVYEARQVTEAARRAKVATQLGNQGQADSIARMIQEYILDGAIGPVREVYVPWGRGFWDPPPGPGRPRQTPPAPQSLNWDLWLGPAPERPYHPAYHPWRWRDWWDFGTGQIGDLGCHKLSTIFKALELGSPTTIVAECAEVNPEIYPRVFNVHFEFPARGDLPPVKLHWLSGGGEPPRPKELEKGRRMSGDLWIGDNGILMGHRLVPETRMRKYGRPPEVLARSPGHDQEFVNACRGGSPAGSDFVAHSGLLTEACLLGNIALRTGKKLAWDGPNFKITNDESANRLLHRQYREGWML
jgi:predicted dehydrogenase